VGGCAWSTMLERSSNWTVFEQAVVRTIPDAYERQRLYAASQLFWDPVDPASYVEDLQGRRILWQESIGDDQVPNLTTEVLARSLGLSIGEPAQTSPVGLDTVPLPADPPLLYQLDPGLGLPPPVNRPSAKTLAHDTPRTWPEVQAQTVQVLQGGQVKEAGPP